MNEILDVLHREFVYIWYHFDVQLRQIFWYWVFGIILGSCVSVFLKDRIHGVLKKMSAGRMGLLGIVPASLLGIASPLCMYGTIPLAASFSRSGMRDEWLASFMMCSILLNPQLIVYSTALGTTALSFRTVPALCASGFDDKIFRRKRSLRRIDGSHHRRSALCLRRRDDSSSAGRASGRYEHGECGCVHDYRSVHKDYKPGSIKDCAGNEALSVLPAFCYDIFPDDGTCCQLIVKNRLLPFSVCLKVLP